MREHKFRLVDKHKETGEIHYSYITLDEIEGEDSWQGKTPWIRISNDEFTGLRDKNLKEIYEGDIVIFEANYKIRIIDGEEIEGYSYTKHIIEFGNGTFLSSIIEQKDRYYGKIPSNKISMFFEQWNKSEVISNIHEKDE